MSELLPGSELLGFGFDISGQYSESSKTLRVLPEATAGQRTHAVGGTTYAVPSGGSVTRGMGMPTMAATCFVAESETEMQEHFATEAKVYGSYAGFSGEVEALYGTDSSNSHSSWYAIAEGSYEAFSIELDQLTPSEDFLNDQDVQKMLAHSTFDPKWQDDFYRVFKRYGTHVVYRVAVGASFRYAAKVERSAFSNQDEVRGKLDLEYRAVTVGAGAEIQTEWSQLGKSWASSRQVKITAIGGSPALISCVDPGYGGSLAAGFAKWLDTIEQRPDVIGFQLKQLSDLFEDSPSDALAAAIKAYTGQNIYVEARVANGQYEGLIRISGVDQPRNPPSTPSGGAQLALFDPATAAIVHVGEVYGCDGDASALWDKLVTDAAAFDKPDQIAVLTVYAWYSNYYPSPKADQWLRFHGATLQDWPTSLDPRCMVVYTLIGRKGAEPGDAIERIDWDHGQGIALASSKAALIPQVGGGLELGLTKV